jgi:hypothetical protein
LKKIFIILGSLILILIGTILFAWHRFGSSTDDRRVLGFVEESKDLTWGLGVAFKPTTLIELVKPEHKSHLDFLKTKIISMAGWAPQDEEWWKKNISAFATGKLNGKPFYLFSASSNPNALKGELLSGKLIEKNQDGTYHLISQKDCSKVGPVKITIDGDILAFLPVEAKPIFSSQSLSLKVLSLSMKPSFFLDPNEFQDNFLVSIIRMSGALDVMTKIKGVVEIIPEGSAMIFLKLDFNDINKGKKLLEEMKIEKSSLMLQNLAKSVSIQDKSMSLKLKDSNISTLIASDSKNENGASDERKKVTAKALADLESDSEQDNIVNYSESPTMEEIFDDCKERSVIFTNGPQKIYGYVSNWYRSYAAFPRGSFLETTAKLCLNPGYIPLYADDEILKMEVTSPVPSNNVCGVELNQKGFKSVTVIKKNDRTFKSLLTIGISDEQINATKEVKGIVVMNLTKKVKKLNQPFVAPYEFELPIGGGKIKITSKLGWNGIELTVMPIGAVPSILDIRGLSKKRTYLSSQNELSNFAQNFFSNLIGLKKPKQIELSFRGQLAELEIIYVEETQRLSTPFTIPWSIPSDNVTPVEDVKNYIVSAETFPSFFSEEKDALKIRTDIQEEKDLDVFPNNVQTSGPFLIQLYRPDKMFKNDIRFMTHSDYFKAMEGQQDYKITIKKAVFSNGKQLELEPLLEKPVVDNFGREQLPWGHYNYSTTRQNGGQGKYIYSFFDDYLRGDDDKDGVNTKVLNGSISTNIPTSYELSQMIPINILKSADFSGLTFSINSHTDKSLDVLVKGEDFINTNLDFIGISKDGKVQRLSQKNIENYSDGKIYDLGSSGPINSIFVVKYSKEKKTFEFPFAFGQEEKPKPTSKPKNKMKKNKKMKK